MGRRLMVDLPEATYAAVRERARALGETPEQVVLDSVEAALGMPSTNSAGRESDGNGREGAAPERDPLVALVGTLACDARDVADRHDEYIGRGIADSGAAR